MKRVIALVLSAALAVPSASLLAQQSITGQKPAQVTAANEGAAGAGAEGPGAGAATSAAIAGLGIAALIAAGVAVAFAVAVSNSKSDVVVTTGTR